MSGRGTVLLVAVLAVLAAYLWLGEIRPQRGAAPDVASESASPPLFRLQAAAVARVELQDSEGLLTAVRGPDGWTDTAGRPWQRDAVTELLDMLHTLGPVMVADGDPSQPSEYGLGPDAPRLELKDKDGKLLLRLEVGERNPAWTGLYVRVDRRPEVMLVGAVLRWQLEQLRASAPAL